MPSKPKKKPTDQPAKIGRPREWTPERIEKERISLEAWIAIPKSYYVLEWLNQRGIDYTQAEKLASLSPSFQQTYARARAIQEQRLVDLAVSRKGDGNFIKFVLQNKAGWREKQELSGDAKNPLAVIMDKIAQSSKGPLDDYDE